MMSKYRFAPDKNAKLKRERDISFEEVIIAISNDGLLDILEHSNREKYADQKMYIVYVNEYVYLVPFVQDASGDIFLKTIIPSRKAKRRYFIRGDHDE